MTPKWGPERLRDGGVRFRLWAPDRAQITLEIRDGEPVAMTPVEGGWFEAVAPVGPGAGYRFRLDPDLAVPDPASRAQEGGVHGWSLVTDPGAYAWRCGDWLGRPWTETVIQELHVGVMGGFGGVRAQLPAIAELGVTAIELMPIAEFSGGRNWGYDGVLPYAVSASYGAPDELKALIDEAHDLGLMVFLDVVYNHFGPDGNYLGAYAAAFFDTEAETPWGGRIAVSKAPVRRFIIDSAIMWLDEFRFDGLRFDAVHAIADTGFLDAMATEIRQTFPSDRRIHLVLENEHNDPDRLAEGGYDAQWNDDFHNVLHVLLTGETAGYYAAFADAPTQKLARCLAEGFIHQGEAEPGRPVRGKPSAHLPATAFVSFLQNHDQVGNRAMGERLILLTEPDRLAAATALLLLCPQMPLLFMGDETGSRSPFLFFTDFHDELADAVREGRRREFANFAAFSDAEARARIPDPNAPATFERSRPEPGPDAAEWRRLYGELLACRRDAVAPRLEGALGLGARVLGDGAVTAAWRMADGATLTLAVNLGSTQVSFPEVHGDMFYALKTGGEPASFAAWLSA